MAESASSGDVTRLLEQLEQGEGDAAALLFPIVYEELRSLAESQLRRERPGHTLQPTALVHEAWLKLAGQRSATYESRGHFFAIAATAMRRVLVRHAEKRQSQKRGAGQRPLELEAAGEVAIREGSEGVDIVALDEALGRLEVLDARKSRVVELRFFTGLSVEETAAALGSSAATVKRDWEFARVWLLRELSR